MSYPLAVVVPTYNRCDALEQCMERLEKQEWKDFEVILVDDGSTDPTEMWVAKYLERTPLAVRYLRQTNSGPARARNLGICLTEAPVTVLIGDDIFVTPRFTAVHRELHAQRPEISVVGVGLTVWEEKQQRITPFMRWLDTHGMQFDYGKLLAGAKPGWQHFYTSNLSFKTELLRQFPFDEAFPYAAMEDIEAACRIEANLGLDMVFLPDALASHLHPMTFRSACRRMEKIGESTAYFHTLWPEKLPHIQNPLAMRIRKLLERIPFAIPLAERIASASVHLACPNRLMSFFLSYHFDHGYERYTARHLAGKR